MLGWVEHSAKLSKLSLDEFRLFLFPLIIGLVYNLASQYSFTLHESVRVWSFSGPYFPAFGLNTEKYGVSLPIQFKCGKIRTRKLRIRTLFTQCYVDRYHLEYSCRYFGNTFEKLKQQILKVKNLKDEK